MVRLHVANLMMQFVHKGADVNKTCRIDVIRVKYYKQPNEVSFNTIVLLSHGVPFVLFQLHQESRGAFLEMIFKVLSPLLPFRRAFRHNFTLSKK